MRCLIFIMENFYTDKMASFTLDQLKGQILTYFKTYYDHLVSTMWFPMLVICQFSYCRHRSPILAASGSLWLHSGMLTHLPLDKMTAISDIFKPICFNENIRIAIKISEIRSLESNWQYVSIGSGNGLTPNRRQAITWTNADPLHWRTYASLGLNELTGMRLGGAVYLWGHPGRETQTSS